jgi:hypothetical protein
MKYTYVRQTAGHNWADYKTNTEIEKEPNIIPVLHKIQEFIRNWLQHTNGTPCNRLPGILISYRPTGRRNQRRPLRLLDVVSRTGQRVVELRVSWMKIMGLKSTTNYINQT